MTVLDRNELMEITDSVQATLCSTVFLEHIAFELIVKFSFQSILLQMLEYLVLY